MISLRKQENITQKELAALTGNKQQVISRIERKESIPTIKAFSHMLDALGYELQIVKRNLYNTGMGRTDFGVLPIPVLYRFFAVHTFSDRWHKNINLHRCLVCCKF